MCGSPNTNRTGLHVPSCWPRLAYMAKRAAPTRSRSVLSAIPRSAASCSGVSLWCECLGLARSAERDAVLIRRHPLVERLQLGIQRTRELDAAVAGVEIIEVGPELEHVPDVVGAGKAEAGRRRAARRCSAPPRRVPA